MIPAQDIKATRILAKSLFKELRGNGYSPNQILSLSTELIDLVTSRIVAMSFCEPRSWTRVLSS